MGVLPRYVPRVGGGDDELEEGRGGKGVIRNLRKPSLAGHRHGEGKKGTRFLNPNRTWLIITSTEPRKTLFPENVRFYMPHLIPTYSQVSIADFNPSVLKLRKYILPTF